MKIKSVISGMLAVAGILCWGDDIQHETVNGLTWGYTVSNGSATVYGGSFEEWDDEEDGYVEAFYPAIPEGTSGAIAVPSTLGGYPVTAIGNGAFCECHNLTSVTVPAGVVTIGEESFTDCESMVGVTLPEGLKSIGDDAFDGCGNLRSVTLPESLTSIGSRAFDDCASLPSIRIPPKVKTIGYHSFARDYGLKTVEVPERLRAQIAENAVFYKCSPKITYYSSIPVITFDANGGKIGSQAKVTLACAEEDEEGDVHTYVMPDDPVKAGADFDGWWTAKDGGVQVQDGAEVDLSIFANAKTPTLYAQWRIAHKITVSGGVLTGEPTVTTTKGGLYRGDEVGVSIDYNKLYDKSGNEVNAFANWTYTPATADLGADFNPFSPEVTVSMPNADVKLTANFVNGFAAYIYCAGGYMDGDEDGLPEGEFYWSVDNGKTLIPFGYEYPVKPGTVTVKFYDKTGNWRAGDWTYTVEKRGTYKEGSTTYYLDPAFFYLSSVKFVPVKKSTAVKLDANGGSGSKETFLVEGYPFGALPIATRKGYVFAGWWTQKDGGEHVIEDKIFQAADFAGQKTPTIYAHWLQLRKLTLKETKGAWQDAYWFVEPEHFDGDYQLFSEISASYYRLHPELEDEGYLQGYSDEKGVMEVLPGAQVYVEASDEIVDKNGNELTFQKWTVSPSKADMGANFFASNPSTDLTMPDADVSLQPTYIDANACGWVHGYAYANSIYLGWDEEAEMDVTLYPPAGAFEWSPDGGKTWYKASSGNYDAPDALLKEGRYTITWRSTDPHWVTTDKTTVTVGGCSSCGIGDASVNASFTYVPEITIDVMTIGGSICEPSCAPGGTATMNPKDGLLFPKKTITLTAKAAKDYAFQGWALAKYWEYGDSFKNTDATWKLENFTYVDMCGDGGSYLNNYIDPTDKKVHVVAVFKALSAYSEDDISFDGFEGSDTYNGADDDAVTIKAVVGCALDDDLALVCGPLAGPLAYKLNGKLPDGLKFDAKKGVLSGAPKKPGETTVTITATDPAKNAKNLTVNFIVNSLPDWLVGEFRGIMSEEKYVPGYWDWDDEAQEDVWVDGEYLPSQQNGILELSVKSDGKVSAKVLTALGSRSVSGTLTWRDPETDEDYDDEDEFAEFRFWHTDKDDSYCHVRFYSDGTIDGDVDSYDKKEDDWFGGDMVGMRQDTELLEQSPFLDKYYTFAFCAETTSGKRWDDELQDYVLDESKMKSGYGYLTLKTDKKGVAKVAGQLPDGEKVSMSALVLPFVDDESEALKARLYVFASPSSYKKQDWFAMSLVVSDDGTVMSEEGAAWTVADISGGGGLCDPYSSTAADVFGSGALYSAAQSLEDYYWMAYCAYSEKVQLEYTCKATYKEGGKTYTDTWAETASARGFYSEFLDNDCFFCVAVQGDAKGAVNLVEKSPAPWARAYKEGGQSFMEWEYSKDKNGKEITDPSQLSISFAKATGIFTGKAKVYFDYEVFNYKNGEEIWTKQHKDATLPYSGVMIYDGEGGYNGYGSAVHTFKYTDYDENDKKTTVTKKVTLPVSLEPADGE